MKINLTISCWLLCYLCFGYTDEIDDHFLPFFSKLDFTGKVIFRWNFTSKIIKFQITAPTTGWLGIGFSPSGTMKGADIIFGWIRDGKPHVLDMHGNRNGLPIIDTKNNIRYSSMRQNETHTSLFVTRLQDTCDDEHDFHITEDTTRVIFAFGDDIPGGEVPTFASIHGPSNRGVKSLLLLERRLSPLTKKDKSREYNYKSYNIRSNSHTLPARKTYYHCFYQKLPRLNKKHHIVQMEPILTPGNEINIHHIIVYHCNESLVTATMLKTTEECYVNDIGDHWKICAPIVVSWAVGMTAFTLPKHVGFPMGIPGTPKIVKVEIHYDNREMKSDIVDSSGIRMLYTAKLRKYDAGILLTGHDVWPTLMVPPESKDFIVQGHCSTDCLGKIMELGNVSQINAFGVFLHSHTAGHQMALRHYRNGTELKPIAKDITYDFDYQETKILLKEREIKMNDNLIMECVYNTIDRKTPTAGGLGTMDEMCFGFLMYYPKIYDAYCQSSPRAAEMYTYLGAEDLQGAYHNATIRNWTDKDRLDFNNVQLTSPVWQLCRTMSGQLKGLQQPHDVPAVNARFQESPRTCDVKKKRNYRKSLQPTTTKHSFTKEKDATSSSVIGSINPFVLVTSATILGTIIITVLGLIYDRFI